MFYFYFKKFGHQPGFCQRSLVPCDWTRHEHLVIWRGPYPPGYLQSLILCNRVPAPAELLKCPPENLMIQYSIIQVLHNGFIETIISYLVFFDNLLEKLLFLKKKTIATSRSFLVWWQWFPILKLHTKASYLKCWTEKLINLKSLQIF